jgi:hypothetical protein
MDYDTTSIRLKFIGKIANGQRINTTNLSIVSPGWISTIYRITLGESRKHTLTFISDTIDRAIELMTLSPIYKDDIIHDLLASENGMKALCYTYKDDLHFDSSMKNIIERIHRATNNKKQQLS